MLDSSQTLEKNAESKGLTLLSDSPLTSAIAKPCQSVLNLAVLGAGCQVFIYGVCKFAWALLPTLCLSPQTPLSSVVDDGSLLLVLVSPSGPWPPGHHVFSTLDTGWFHLVGLGLQAIMFLAPWTPGVNHRVLFAFLCFA